MSKLVDKERLAKLAQALDARMKAAVKAEKERAMGVEANINAQALQNKAAIEAINNENTGILAQAKNHCDSVKDDLLPKINAKVSQEEYNAKVTELESKDEDMAEDILELGAAIQSINTKLGEGDLKLPEVDEKIEDFKEEQLQKDNAQDAKVADLEEAVFGKEGEKAGLEAEMDAVEGRVLAIENADFQKQINDEKKAREDEDIALNGRIDALDERVEAVEEFKTTHEGQYSEIQGKVAALEEKFVEGGVVDGKVSKVQEAVDELKDAYEEFVAAQATKEQEQDDAIAAKVAQSVYDEQVQALVDKDAELNKAIADEAAAARAAEQALEQRIDAIVAAETGILDQAKAHAQGLVDAEKGLREKADEALQGQINTINSDAEALEARVKANENKLAVVQGADSVEGSIAKAEKDAKDYADGKIAALVDSAPEAMNTLNELAQAIKDHGDVYEAYIAQHAKDCQDAADKAQAAAEAKAAELDATLKAELQKEIKDEADRAKVEEADIRSDFATADAQVLVDAKAYTDQEVGKEKGRAEGQEAAIRQELANEKAALQGEITAAVLAEENRAKGEEGRIEAAYKLADQGLSGRIADLEEMMGVGGEGADKSALEEIRDAIAALEQEDKDLAAEDQRLDGEIAKKVAQADYDVKVKALEAADEAMDERMDVVEEFVKGHDHTEMENDIDELQAFMSGHSHEAMEKGIADNKAAIEEEVKDRGEAIAQEVLDRNAAIAEALKAYTTSADMKVMLGNIVNSLALTMENNKMVLKLGGAEGVAVTEVSLDMATDDDIDAIIAGLGE